MSTTGRFDGVREELKADWLQNPHVSRWVNSKRAARRGSFVERVDIAYLGGRLSSAMNLTNTTDWFASVGVPVATTYSGRTFLRNTIMPIELRPYQLEAVEKLARPDIPHVGVFDEMGTGKTVIGVAIDAVRRQTFPRGKTLVVAPLGMVCEHWARHFANMQPDLKVVVLDEKARGNSWRYFLETDADVLIIHWEGMRIMAKTHLQDIPWMHIIADEVHRIANKDIATTKALKSIATHHKTGLTGTPAENRPENLWSILNWLYPGTWRSYWNFRKQYTEQEYQAYGNKKFMQVLGPKNVEDLQYQISMYTIRRLKKNVLDIADPNPLIYWCKMHPLQQQAYDAMLNDMVAWVHAKMDETGAVEEDDLNPIIANAVIARLTRLQQFACAYATIDETGQVHLSEPSSKLDVAWDLMMERREEGCNGIVVYSSFKQMIYLMRARLQRAGISYVEVTGDIKKPDRIKAVDAFQNGEVDVFLGTIRAGGEGIDLFRSQTLINLSRDWNPAKNEQVEGRLIRSGQTGVVDVIDIYVENTVEIDKKETVAMKWSWVKKLLGDE